MPMKTVALAAVPSSSSERRSKRSPLKLKSKAQLSTSRLNQNIVEMEHSIESVGSASIHESASSLMRQSDLGKVQEIADLREILSETSRELCIVQERNKILEEQHMSHVSEDSGRKLALAMEKNAELLSECSRLKSTSAKLIHENASLKERWRAAESRREKALASTKNNTQSSAGFSAEQRMSEHIAALETELEDLKNENLALLGTKIGKRSSGSVSPERHSPAKDPSKDMVRIVQTSNEKLQSEIDQLAFEKTAMETRMGSIEAARQHLAEENKRLLQELLQFRQETKKCSDTMQMTKGREEFGAQPFAEKVQSGEKDTCDHDEVLGHLEEEVSLLTGKLHDCSRRNHSLEQDLDALSCQRDVISKEKNALQEEVERLSAELSTKSSSIVNGEELRVEWQRSLDKKDHIIACLEKEKDGMRADILELCDQLVKMQRGCVACQEKTETISVLKLKIKELKEQREDFGQGESDRFVELEEERRLLSRTIEVFNRSLSEVASENALLVDKHNDLLRQYHHTRTLLNSMRGHEGSIQRELYDASCRLPVYQPQVPNDSVRPDVVEKRMKSVREGWERTISENWRLRRELAQEKARTGDFLASVAEETLRLKSEIVRSPLVGGEGLIANRLEKHLVIQRCQEAKESAGSIRETLALCRKDMVNVCSQFNDEIGGTLKAIMGLRKGNGNMQMAQPDVKRKLKLCHGVARELRDEVTQLKWQVRTDLLDYFWSSLECVSTLCRGMVEQVRVSSEDTFTTLANHRFSLRQMQLQLEQQRQLDASYVLLPYNELKIKLEGLLKSQASATDHLSPIGNVTCVDSEPGEVEDMVNRISHIVNTGQPSANTFSREKLERALNQLSPASMKKYT